MMKKNKTGKTTRKKGYNPNHIPRRERIQSFLFSLVLIIYGSIGIIFDDLYIPGKASPGMHLHGFPCWIMYAAFLSGAANMLSVIIDHYDKRNNEIKYAQFAKFTKYLGWTLFFGSMLLDIFIFQLSTRH